MKVQATSYVSTTIVGEIREDELLALVAGAGIHVPEGARVRFWVSGRTTVGDLDVDGEEPLRFSITYQSERVTTPPVSDRGVLPT